MRSLSTLSFIAASFLSLVLSVSLASADVTIGNGFTCSGDSILKGNKTVNFSKAKSTLAQTIEKLKSKLETAPKKKKPGLKAQLAAAKQSKTLLTVCHKGDLDATQVDPIFTQLASGTGIYKGTYSGFVGGFLPISGNVQMVFELEGSVFGATLSLGGNLGSTLKAQPLAFQSDVGGVGFPAQFFLQNTFLGDVTLSVSANGHLTIKNSNSSKGVVTFEGDFGSSNIVSTINGSYSGVSFTGNTTLARQP